MADQNMCREKLLSAAAAGMLRSRNAADRQAIAAVRETMKHLNFRQDEDCLPADPLMRKAYLELAETCFRLQYRVMCTEELLCYDGGAEKPAEAVDLCRTLRRFINQADELTDCCLEIGECEVPHGLYAYVQPERLNFALLHLLTEAVSEHPDFNTLDFTASCVQNDLLIELVLRCDPDAETEPFLQDVPAAVCEGSPDDPAVLTERFCSCFGVRMLRQANAGRSACILTIPAAKALNPLLKVSSDSAEYYDSAAFLASLSRVVPTEILLTAAAECL